MDSALESWDSNGLDGVSGKGNDKANSQEPQPFDGLFIVSERVKIQILVTVRFSSSS